jgi:hypothetical protein
MDSEPILKKTLVTVGVMVGAWVAFVGTVSLVAVVVTSPVVGSTSDPGGDATGTAPVPGVRPNPLHPAGGARSTANSHRAPDSI